MNTIASLLDPQKLAQLMELATQADVPADQAVPTELIAATCELCGTDVQVAAPVLGTIACVGCATARCSGRAGRRYLKTRPSPMISIPPQRLARAGGIDLSNYSDGELGEKVRRSLLNLTAMQDIPEPPEEPELSPDQTGKVAALMETYRWDRQRATTFVIRMSQP